MPAHIMPESISGRGGFRIVIALAAAVEAILRMIYTKNFNSAWSESDQYIGQGFLRGPKKPYMYYK